jgi:hypothetical protein
MRAGLRDRRHLHVRALGASTAVCSRTLALLRTDPGYPVRRRAGTGYIGLLSSVADARIVPRIGLDLGFLVHAQHDRLVRRAEIQPDDVAELCLELRVGGELERLGPPRLQSLLPPHVRDRIRLRLPGR